MSKSVQPQRIPKLNRRINFFFFFFFGGENQRINYFSINAASTANSYLMPKIAFYIYFLKKFILFSLFVYLKFLFFESHFFIFSIVCLKNFLFFIFINFQQINFSTPKKKTNSITKNCEWNQILFQQLKHFLFANVRNNQSIL